MTVLLSVFTTVFKRRDVRILLAFVSLPLIIPSLSGISEQQINQDVTGSFLSFLLSILEVQYQLVLPSLIICFIVSSVFRDEINSGQLFLYKDIKRCKILNAKLLSLFLVYTLYLLGTVVVSAGVYLFHIVPQAGFRLLPIADTPKIFLGICTIVALNLILMCLVAAVSIKRTTLVAVLTGILFNLVMQVGPLLNGFRYVCPHTYPNLLGKMPFVLALAISFGLSILYIGIAYRSARRNFNNIEY